MSFKRSKDWLVKQLNFVGVDPFVFRENLSGSRAYKQDLRIFKEQLSKNDSFNHLSEYPFLRDRYSKSGEIRGHYFSQDLFVASEIYKERPQHHVDIGSRIDGFIAHLAVFMPVEVVDIRPQEMSISNVKFIQMDFTKAEMVEEGYCDSLSCLHAIEHFGLGRYGDEIDVDGHIKCLDNLHKMLKPSGKLYLSTPIGKQRVEFNAHRVFSLQYLLELFQDKFDLQSFSYIDDSSKLHQHVEMTPEDVNTNFGCHFGCGIFQLTKKQ